MPNPITADELSARLADLMPGIGLHRLLLDDSSWARLLAGLRLLEASEADGNSHVAILDKHALAVEAAEMYRCYEDNL